MVGREQVGLTARECAVVRFVGLAIGPLRLSVHGVVGEAVSG